jgi:DNA-binding XRE family transcriptional regulator
MTQSEFMEWRLWMGWTQAKAAEHLGISTRSVQLYEKGKQAVPKAIALACMTLMTGVREYRAPDRASTSMS